MASTQELRQRLSRLEARFSRRHAEFMADGEIDGSEQTKLNRITSMIADLNQTIERRMAQTAEGAEPSDSSADADSEREPPAEAGSTNASQSDREGSTQSRSASNRRRHLRRQIRVPETFSAFEREVERWIASQVASRSRRDGRPTEEGERVPEREQIRRERELVRRNPSLRQVWDAIRALQGQQVTITGELNWGPYQIDSINFTTDQARFNFEDDEVVRGAPDPDSPEEQQRVEDGEAQITANLDDIPEPPRAVGDDRWGRPLEYLTYVEGYIAAMNAILGGATVPPNHEADPTQYENNTVCSQRWARPGVRHATRVWNGLPVEQRRAIQRNPGARREFRNQLSRRFEEIQQSLINNTHAGAQESD